MKCTLCENKINSIVARGHLIDLYGTYVAACCDAHLERARSNPRLCRVTEETQLLCCPSDWAPALEVRA